MGMKKDLDLKKGSTHPYDTEMSFEMSTMDFSEPLGDANWNLDGGGVGDEERAAELLRQLEL